MRFVMKEDRKACGLMLRVSPEAEGRSASGRYAGGGIAAVGNRKEDTQQHNFEEGVVVAGCGVMGVGAN